MMDSDTSEKSNDEVVHTSNVPEASEEKKPNFPIDKFLDEMALSTPLDYLFQNFAIQKSRQNISKISDQLSFLFHLVRAEDLKQEIPFPHCAFIEKLDGACPDDPSRYIIWSTEESENWKSRKPLSFNEFHLYFLDVIKQMVQYSAEELYKVFDAKRGESYFINNGPRSQSLDGKFHLLFVTTKVIVAFQIPIVSYSEIEDKDLFSCKWVSLSEKVTVRPAFESAVFEFPVSPLVLSPEETKEYNENMEVYGECKDCQI